MNEKCGRKNNVRLHFKRPLAKPMKLEATTMEKKHER